MAIALVVLALVVALAVLPQMWVAGVLRKHGQHRPDFPGTGGELARHLLDGMKLADVKVEPTQIGDHYDPEAKAVRLRPEHFDGKSLAAVVVAAHEVGHAMQDATGFAPLKARTRIARHARVFQMVGAAVMLAAPFMMALTRTPHAFVVELAAGFLIMAFPILMHAVTLPVELDASFNRALPVLEQGGYLEADDLPGARELLRAAAFTYVAAAAWSLLNVAQWLRVLRI